MNNQGYEDEDYLNEQYPPTYDRYRQLNDMLKAMEVQKIPRLYFWELGLVPGVVIPLKFKVPVFAKYDGVSRTKINLRLYVKKIQPHTADRKLWVNLFQESLAGTQLE